METERIIEILDRMEKNQRDSFAKIDAKLSSLQKGNEDWIDSLEVQKILGVTRKTIYRLTLDGTLIAKPIGRRKYYSRIAIFKVKNRFLK